MRRVYSLLIVILFIPFFADAQDEGEVAKKERIDKSNNIFIGFGPSFNFGENIGDYGTGLNLEFGFSKRVNRLLSIGPSISFLKFKYDPEKTQPDDGGYYGTGTIDTDWYGSYWDNWSEKYIDENFDYAYVLTLQGGDLSLLSLAVNVKLNVVPVKDTSPISAYLFVKPFVTQATRKAVSGTGERYVYEAYEDFNGDVAGAPSPYEDGVYENDDILRYNLGDDLWYPDGYTEDWGPESFEALKEEKVITGGVFLGGGVEFMPAKTISIFVQPGVGYTFPISFVSTSSYDNSIDSYVDPEFPIVKEGFTSFNLQIGLSFNF